MSDNGPSKIAGPLDRKVTDEDGDWDTVEASPDDELQLYIRAEPGRVSGALDALRERAIKIRSEDNGYIAADVPALQVVRLADENSIRHIHERRDPKAHAVDSKYITEGEPIVNADTLQSDGITGSGARIAVIDHEFHKDNPKYSDRIVATVGDSTYFTKDSEHDGTSQHGTACAEIVADLAPDAELILATTLGFQSFSQIMDEIESYDPDAATMSLGYYWGMRIDGQDPVSSRVSQFTDGGRLFATSAGNEATYGHWDGQFEDNGNGLMMFDSGLQEPTRYPVYMDTGGQVIVHWDADWSQDDQRYEVRLYRSRTASTPIDTSQTTDPYEVVQLTSADDETSYYGRYFIEIKNVGATGTEHFDLFNWGPASFDCQLSGSECWSTPERSLGIPATSPDDDTMAVAAVQATSVGQTSEEHLKPYSSQGPTQDGRNALDIAAPSMVSTTKPSDWGGYDALEDGGGFNGTSAASPHIGGIFGLLFDSDLDATHTEIRDAVWATGRSIVDSDVSAPGPDNTKIGYGYADAKDAVSRSKTLFWEYQTDSYVSSSPTVVDGTAYVGSFDGHVYAIDTAAGEKQWQFDAQTTVFSSPSVVKGTVYVGTGHWSVSDSETSSESPRGSEAVPSGTNRDGQTMATSEAAKKVKALDADTGEQLWEFTTGGVVQSSPTVLNGKVYVGSFDNYIYALNAETGQKQWQFQTGGQVRSSPTVVGETVYIGSHDTNVYALDAVTGEKVWEYSTGARVGSAPTVAGDTVYVGSNDGSTYALDANTGEKAWEYSTSDIVWSSPTVKNETVYIYSYDSFIYALNAATGEKRWDFETGQGGESSPTVADDRVYVGSSDNLLHVLDAATGDKIRDFEAEGLFISSPTVADGTVYVGNSDNNLYALSMGGTSGSDGSRVSLGTLGHNSVWSNSATEPSVTADGATISQGGEATINISASNVNKITVKKLWTDWDLVDDDPDGGSSTSKIASNGTYIIEWNLVEDSVSPWASVNLPGSTYIGGTYLVSITGTDGSESDTDTALIKIN